MATTSGDRYDPSFLKPNLRSGDAGRPAGNRPTSRWSVEHVGPEECVRRAYGQQPNVEDLHGQYMSGVIKGEAQMLNCPWPFVNHAIGPCFGATGRYTRACRWSGYGNRGHTEPLNKSSLLGADSGTGKSQAMRSVMGEFQTYEKVMSRDLVVRNITIEALETRMHTNSLREPPVRKGAGRQGSALVIMDEAAKLVSLGQYRAGGKGDHRERWMELQNAEFVKTDRKGGGGKEKVAKASNKNPRSPAAVAESTSTASSPSGDTDELAEMVDAEDEDEDEEFTSSLKTEEFHAHMNAILFTHPFRIKGWVDDEQQSEGTDGWTVRLKTVLVESERQRTLPREELEKLAGSEEVMIPLHHLFIASHILCELLPLPDCNSEFKLLKFDQDCEDAFYNEWDLMVVEKIRALKDVPKSQIQCAIYSKSNGDIIRQTGLCGLERIASDAVTLAHGWAPSSEALSQATEGLGLSAPLKGYTGRDPEHFRTILEPILQAMIDAAPKSSSDGYPMLLNVLDYERAKVQVEWEMGTNFALMKKAVLESAPAALPFGAPAADAITKAFQKNFGRHDLVYRLKKANFKKTEPIPGQAGKTRAVDDKLSYLLHIVLTAPRVAPGIISMTMLGSPHASAAPKIYKGPEDGSDAETAFGLLKELSLRGLASPLPEKLPAKDNKGDIERTMEMFKLKPLSMRNYIKVTNLSKLSDANLQPYATELSRLQLTPSALIAMNEEVLPLQATPEELGKWGLWEDMKKEYNKTAIRGPVAVAAPGAAGNKPAPNEPFAPERDGDEVSSEEEPGEMQRAMAAPVTTEDEAMITAALNLGGQHETAEDKTAEDGAAGAAAGAVPVAEASGSGMAVSTTPPRAPKRMHTSPGLAQTAAPNGRAPDAAPAGDPPPGGA